MTRIANLPGIKIEARQGEDGLYRAFANGEPMTDVKASRYGRKVVQWAVKAVREKQAEEQLKAIKEIES